MTFLDLLWLILMVEDDPKGTEIYSYNKIQQDVEDDPKGTEIYSYNKIQQDALFLNLVLVKNSTCFGQSYCPS
jgi:hypothetical protein